MKLTKTLIFTLYTLIVVCIGVATVIEKYHGTSFVGQHIYGSWWFSALWAVLTVSSLAYIMKQQLYKRFALLLLHLSFVVILAGALTTHLTARRGTVRLRAGVSEMTFIDKDRQVQHLPFTLLLKDFRVIHYPGTDAPLDYQSTLQCAQLLPSRDTTEVLVSMNHIGSIEGYRLFQQSYDSDGQGVTLGISHDPYGIAITYTGYLLLLIGIIATLLSRHTQMRSLYRKAITVALLLFSINTSAVANSQFSILNSQFVIDADLAHQMGTILVLYNDRICPLNTVATDFTMKLTGRASWQGYSADEVFFSWMIYYTPWEKELLHNQSQKKGADERRAIVEMFYSGQFTKIFPAPLSCVPSVVSDQRSSASPEGDTIVTSKSIEAPSGAVGGATWFSPGGQVLPREIPVKEQFFIKQSMDFLTEAIVTGQRDRAFEIIAKIKLFQREMVGDKVLPSERMVQTELFYNALRSQKWPVFLSLSLSLLLCIALLGFGRKWQWLGGVTLAFAVALFVFVTLQLALRWLLSGHIPVSNGPETMLFMAWVVLLLPVVIGAKAILKRKHALHSTLYTLHLMAAFTPLVASFCLLVAMLGGSSSQLSPLMPVLQSPLLSIHVMTVMCAYSLFALQMLLGIYALFIRSTKGTGTAVVRSAEGRLPLGYAAWLVQEPEGRKNSTLYTLNSKLERVTALSQLLLYPAVFLLTIGIFLGAVWANVSWGDYWSWDPKESWALITLMVYAVPLHSASIGIFRKPRFYHLYMVIAFLAVLITYFGVNYLLGGMHSYA